MGRDGWFRDISLVIATGLAVAGVIASCGSNQTTDNSAQFVQLPSQEEQTESESSSVLPGDLFGDTNWRLVEFQSMDDTVGTIAPDDPSAFTMRLQEDGTVTMKLDCNNATGTWSAETSGGDHQGSFSFGPLAITRALCLPPNLDERIASDATFIRSYVFEDGRLHLSLMADGGIYTWEPDPGEE